MGPGRNSCTDSFDTYGTSPSYCRASGRPRRRSRANPRLTRRIRPPDPRRPGRSAIRRSAPATVLALAAHLPACRLSTARMGAAMCRSSAATWWPRGARSRHRNLSIPGAVLSRAVEDLARDIGRPIDEPGRQLHRAPVAVRADRYDAPDNFCGRQRRKCHCAGRPRGPRRGGCERLRRCAGASMGHRSRRSGQPRPQPRPQRAHRRA